MKDFKTLKNYDKLSEYDQKMLKKVYHNILDGQIYADIKSVSRSGMSRRIAFYTVEPGEKSNPYYSKPYISRITNYIAWLTGWIPCGEYKSHGKHMVDDGLHVSGCGMDMIFHTLYSALGHENAKKWNQQYRNL